ncbi:MAG TPA: universal stress protein [Dissulfurispiraceae bacterium]
MYKKILVGFDDSNPSRAALAESSNWAKEHGGRLILVHAVYFDPEEFGAAPDQLERRFELGRKVCIQEKDKIVSGLGVEVESLICEGEPPAVINDVAREKGVDLIAMGTYGRKGLNRLLMGSVTSGVIVNAPCDVLVVRNASNGGLGKYRSILLPYDGSDFSRNALERACELAKAEVATVTALYAIPRYEEMIGFFKTDSVKKSLFQEAQKIISGARDLASQRGVSIKVEIEEGRAGDRIVKTAQELKSDLIVMGSYGWRGVDKAIMGSTTERVIMTAPCPVLVVR